MTHAAVALATDEDVLRARLWGLLAALLLQAPSQDVLDRLRGIPGDDSPIGSAFAALAEAARAANPAALADEYADLFIGLTRGEVLPYGSYYLTGFLHEKPLAVLRADLAALGMTKAEGVSEPEDHVGLLAEVMANLIDGPLARDLDTQKRFFATHIQMWGDKFFADLENAEAARFYRPVGALGRAFLRVEAEAFAMTD